jgi:predicted short-subunit dehydrogenase-like oxidoreductase (DUF2520 family)
MAPIAVAGAGPVAQSLGYLLACRGHAVNALASRSREHAERAARFVGADTTPLEYEDLGRLALPTIIAVSDSGLPEVARRMASAAATPSLVIHTCGVAGPDVLAPLRDRGWSCGVLHPLQTIPTREQGIEHLAGASFGIGGDPLAVDWAETLVRSLGGRSLRVRADGFALYHAAAVLAGNGTFALLEAATCLLGEAGVSREAALDALGPLCRSSLANALSSHADARLTGPVARGDVPTIQAHLTALSPFSREATDLYSTITTWLLRVARQQGLSPTCAEQIDHMVRQGHGRE